MKKFDEMSVLSSRLAGPLRLLYGILPFILFLLFVAETIIDRKVYAQVDPVLQKKIESDHETEKELVSISNRVKSPSNYGNIVFNRYTTRFDELKLGKVVFPHWYHRMMFRCKVCHSDIGFIMKKGANNINMSLIIRGQFCGKCHNGIIAFSALDCYRCHSLGLKVERNHKIERFLKVLPATGLGNKVDWVKALEDGIIRPKAAIDGKEKMIVFDKDINFPIKVSYPHPSDVVFPHKAHTEWLFCDSCHPYVFKMKEGGNPELNMTQNLKGLYCGVCHGKVAFPFEDCFRCHKMTEVPDF